MDKLWLELSKEAGTDLVQVEGSFSGHAACTVGGTTIVWGGFGSSDAYRDPSSVLLLCLDLIDYNKPIWIRVNCDKGDVPNRTSGASVAFVSGHLVIFGGFSNGPPDGGGLPQSDSTNRVYTLNMETRTWKRVVYGDMQPRPTPRDKGCGWSYRNRAFFFSGYGAPPSHAAEFQEHSSIREDLDSESDRVWNNQLLEFDLKTETWRCLKTSGSIPSPRAAAASCIVEDQVFVFGGRTFQTRLRDLYQLDMNSLVWTRIEMAKAPQEDIIGRSWTSICVTDDLTRCYIWGGFLNGMDRIIISDQIIEGDLVKNKWLATSYSLNDRHWHVAFLHSGILMALGGLGMFPDERHQLVECVTVQPNSLRMLAFNQITLRGTRNMLIHPFLEKRLYLRTLLRGCPAPQHVLLFRDDGPLSLLQIATI